jgi:aspartate aminotransferase
MSHLLHLGADQVKPRIAHRAGIVSRVASREVSDRAGELSRQGVDVLPLLGWPSITPPDHLIQAATQAAASTTHPPSSGIPELKEALAGKLCSENGMHLHRPEGQIIITNGAFHALYICLATLLDPGDEVLLFSPSFFFDGIIGLIGGEAHYVPLDRNNGFGFDADALKAAVTKRTKVLLLNTPANPTGHVATLEELKAIMRVAEENDLLVISDESYERMVYDGLSHECIGALPGAESRVITVQSFTKAYAMPQWRVGYIVCPAHFYSHFVKTLEWMVLSCNHVAQRCAWAAVTGPGGWWKAVARDFERKRDIVCSGLDAIEGIQCVKPQGTPFIFPRVRDLGVSGTEFAKYVLENHGIPAVPGAAFQDDDHVRIPFGAEDGVLHDLVTRMTGAVKKLRVKKAGVSRNPV